MTFVGSLRRAGPCRETASGAGAQWAVLYIARPGVPVMPDLAAKKGAEAGEPEPRRIAGP